jgi:hypothetical protein
MTKEYDGPLLNIDTVLDPVFQGLAIKNKQFFLIDDRLDMGVFSEAYYTLQYTILGAFVQLLATKHPEIAVENFFIITNKKTEFNSAYFKTGRYKNFTLIFIPTILRVPKSEGHINFMIYEVETGILEHYDSGKAQPQSVQDQQQTFVRWFDKMKIPLNDYYIPTCRPMQISEQNRAHALARAPNMRFHDPYYCLIWCMVFMRMIAKHPEDTRSAYKRVVKAIHAKKLYTKYPNEFYARRYSLWWMYFLYMLAKMAPKAKTVLVAMKQPGVLQKTVKAVGFPDDIQI